MSDGKIFTYYLVSVSKADEKRSTERPSYGKLTVMKFAL
jgi:hypothetical protein